MSYLRAVGEVSDQGGLASTALAEAVGYPGSNLAFAQLLSAMERSGLIEREVRGRRTYRITLAPGAAPTAPTATVEREAGRQAPRGGMRVPEPGPEPGPEPDAVIGLDYDELARRLLVELVHRLAAPGSSPQGNTASGSGLAPDAERSLAERELGLRPAQDDSDLDWTGEPTWVGNLARTVASLERKLASVEAQRRALRAENTRLREQLAATRQSLAEQSLTAARDSGAYLNRLDTGAVQLLERLLASLRSEEGRGDSARGQSADAG